MTKTKTLTILCFISILLSSCSSNSNQSDKNQIKLIFENLFGDYKQNFISEQEKVIVNPQNVNEITYKQNKYTILDETVESDKVGYFAGYIGEVVISDKNGNIVDTLDIYDDFDKNLFNDENNIINIDTFTNIYLNKDDSTELVIFTDDFHRVILTENLSENDVVLFPIGEFEVGSIPE